MRQKTRYFVKKYLYNSFYKKQLKESSFPPEVWIENTNCCNAQCVMCPRDKHTRPQGVMIFSLYQKLIEEISLYKGTTQRIHLHNYGEPLLDKMLPEKIRFAKAKGIQYVYFVTNASLLSRQLSRSLIESGLDGFKISFYGTDKSTYNKTMVGLDFDQTIKNVEDFFDVRRSLNATGPSVVIQYLPQASNNMEKDRFTALFERVIDRSLGDRMNIFSLHNFGDGREYHKHNSNVCSICDYPWRTMVILQDGRAVLCCLDYNGIQVVGDANRQSIKEIWGGYEYSKVRKDFKRLAYGDYSFCSRCERIR